MWDGKSIPDRAVEFVKQIEAFHAEPYDDGYGFWTIGYGARRGVGGMEVTRRTPAVSAEEAEQLLRRDLEVARADVARRFGAGSITVQQAAALISLVFNLGSLSAAPTLVGMIKRGDLAAAANQFGAYRMSAGRPSRGLRRRRWVEAAIFLGNADPVLAWPQAETLIQTPDDWPPLAMGGEQGASVPTAPAAPIAPPRPVPVHTIGDGMSEADRLNEQQLQQMRRDRSHG